MGTVGKQKPPPVGGLYKKCVLTCELNFEIIVYMDNVEFSISVHIRPDGSVPFKEAMFTFGSSSIELVEAVKAGLVKLKSGSNQGYPLTKYLEDNICYLRVKRARVFFTFRKGARIILLNGFIKNQKKTPVGEIKLARMLKKEATA